MASMHQDDVRRQNTHRIASEAGAAASASGREESATRCLWACAGCLAWRLAAASAFTSRMYSSSATPSTLVRSASLPKLLGARKPGHTVEG